MQLNNGRWQFLNKAKATKARIVAWESKHLADIAEKLPPPNLVQPEYFDEGVHVFPVNSSVIFRCVCSRRLGLRRLTTRVALQGEGALVSHRSRS